MALEVKETSGKLLAGGNYTTSFPTVGSKPGLTSDFASGSKLAGRPKQGSKPTRAWKRSSGHRKPQQKRRTIIS